MNKTAKSYVKPLWTEGTTRKPDTGTRDTVNRDTGNPKNAETGSLTVREAAGIIAGYGIGGGVLALPWLVSLNGLGLSLLVIAAAWFLSLLLHLMIAELCAGDGSGKQILELFRKYLFRERRRGVHGVDLTDRIDTA